jgi:prevent-host-death family protein
VHELSDEVSVRQLRNQTAAILRRVEAGESLRVTIDGRPVAEFKPLATRASWVPRHRIVDGLVQADAELRRELDATVGDTIADM